jgi:HD superfamily phosphohydrolase
LCESRHLKTLDISYNPLDVSALNAIASCMERNSGIEHFYISPILQQSTIQTETLDQIISTIYSCIQKNKRRTLQDDMVTADQTVQVLEEMIDETKRLSLAGFKRTESQEELVDYLRKECTRFKEELRKIMKEEEIRDPQLRARISCLYNHLERATSIHWQLDPQQPTPQDSPIKYDQFHMENNGHAKPLLGLLDMQVFLLVYLLFR